MGKSNKKNSYQEDGYSYLSTGATDYRESKPNYTYADSEYGSTTGYNTTNMTGAGSNSAYTLPDVGNYSATYVAEDAASTLKSEYEKYVQSTRPTSEIIDQRIKDLDLTSDVREDVEGSFDRTKDSMKRNRSRYGATLTPMEQIELDRGLQREEKSAIAGGLTNARVQERDMKDRLFSTKYNLELADYKEGLAGLASGGKTAYALKDEYQRQKTAYKQEQLGDLFNLFTTGVNAFRAG